ncbi:DUF3153 domain-containing protein [Synechococcus sp. Tobar12-5m-g]|uniref:DUF3153 domain-containing protein n=1 Tax=unclassified Synechococcus TaxID=2626047 RepID=UPI0020CF14F4|nr:MULTISPECIES: DUF3153 domain-containing protein [unclassified Synechococcus]MCP9771831.1 DUF3153 domain-containing protein [Synechococcus sp. Tobar12-5m-g]MCP9872773.1 DUF3153 domain-containing protein [Synechococcus sp. Cruz CV-v-12]
MAEDPLLPARLALERGEYGSCLRLLEPLAAAHPASTGLGGTLRLLMVTALLGQGNDAGAVACCRSLRACLDLDVRSQAKDLQLILEAPPLQRPANWSLSLPVLGGADALEGRAKATASQRRQAPTPVSPPPPPVGPTRAPVGFAVVVVAVLLLLTSLLSGCLRVDTDLRFGPPGRLQLRQTLSSKTGRLLPWQRQFVSDLKAAPLERATALGIETHRGVVSLTSASVASQEINRLLALTATTAADLGGLALPPPTLALRERNWLLGAQQQFSLEVDLRQVGALPGLDLSVALGPLGRGAVRSAQPRASQPEGDGVRWGLAIGALNRLELVSWRWSRLGLGGIAILLLLALALALQRLRWQAGFGWPELPAPEKP